MLRMWWVVVVSGTCLAGTAPQGLRTVGYHNPSAPCLYARDLPLIALIGADTVVTRDLLPERETNFAALLESTGLRWIAEFHVDAPAADTLAAFRTYALRLRGPHRPMAYLVSEPFAADAAAALSQIGPGDPPAVWTSLPVAAEFIGGLFSAQTAAGVTLDTLRPTPLYYHLAGLWRGSYPPAWAEPVQPKLAPPAESVTPGALVRLEGKALLNSALPYSDETWPLVLAQTCLCVGGAPARLSFLSESTVIAQIPQGVEPGERELVFYRAGQASNALAVLVRQVAAEGFNGTELIALRETR